MKMWKAALALPLLLIAGCASNAGQPASAPTATPTASYADQMRDIDHFFGYADSDLQSAGESICAAMEDGTTFERAKELLGMNGMSDGEASEAVRLSVDEYCPQLAG